MTTNPTTESPALVIKGSWEDVLAQAHRAAANQNDEAIALYEKVVNGLQRLSATQRRANDGRLQDLLKTAAANLHVYLTQREYYDQALAGLALIETIVDEDERKAWQQRAAMVLDQAGRAEEAIAHLRALTATEDAKLSDWGNLVTQHIKQKQFVQAEQVIEEATQWAANQPPTGENGDENTAYLAHLRSFLALSQGKWDEGIAHFERAAALAPEYKDSPHLLYARLMFYNQPELALRFIQRDAKHPVQAGFWYGVALKRLGREAEAKRQWEQLIKSIGPKTDDEHFIELVLTFYYLGDAEGRGLNAVLRTLQSGGARSWLLLYLAGLGWALRGNAHSARTNFALAVTRRKGGAEGTKLSAEVWQYCKDLLSEDIQTQIIEYFHTEK